MTNNNQLNLDSLCLHAGHKVDSDTLSRAVPIYQTASYLFHDSNHAQKLFALEEGGNIYTRLMNPTTDVLEKRIAALDGGIAALATASGQAAISLSLLNIAQCGDEIVSTSDLYGGTYTLLRYTFKKFGIKVNFVPTDDHQAIELAITEKTKALYTESIGNPKLNVANIQKLSEIAHKNKIPLIVDNTVAPYLLRPIDYGADVVVYSATKFLGGHGTSIGGLIVDSGKFNWNNGNFPLLSEPDPSYHNLNFIDALKPNENLVYMTKARVSLMRDLGPVMSPFNSFLFLQGLETLHLRMIRHSENALKVALFLEQHEKVSWVNYPGLESSSEKQKAEKYLPKGAGALIGFGIKGGINAGKKFIDSLKLVSHLANIGDAKSLAIHPASTTHQQLSEQEQLKAGISPDFIRLSIGIEHFHDIISDLNQAINQP